MPEPLSLVVLISGGGTTLQNLLDRIVAGTLHARIVHVISSKPEAYGVQRAKMAGIPTSIIERNTDPGTFSDRVFAAIRSTPAELVVLGGWLQLLKIPPDYQGRILNIHPSLLPKFGGRGMYGHHVHEAVLNADEHESGCTIHIVDDAYDNGPIILQRKVPVLNADTPESLAERVFEAECEAYPIAIEQVGYALRSTDCETEG